MELQESNYNNKKSTIIFSSVVAVLCVLRAWIQTYVPIYPILDATYDDMLMINYAVNLGTEEGGWLGMYDLYTLNKPVGYAFLLKFNQLIHCHYELLYGIILSLSCVALFIAARKLFKSNLTGLVIFISALCCPITIECNVAGRIYNMSMVPICVLLLMASYIGIIAERNEGFLKMLPWIIISSLTYAYYRILRVDYIWIDLFLIGITAYLIVLYFIENKDDKIKNIIFRIAFYLIIFLVGILSTNTLRLVNYFNYGVYATTDFDETHFAKMCSLLLSVKPDKEIPGVYVTKDALYKAAEVSPNLKRLVDQRETSGWRFTRADDGEMDIEFFAWNLRFSASELGLYEDAAATDEYYKVICDDLEKAFDDGRLQDRGVITISPFSAPLFVKDIPKMLSYSIKRGFASVLGWKDINAAYYISEVPTDDIRSLNCEWVTNEEVISVDELDNGLSIAGWFCPKKSGDTLRIMIYDKEEKVYFPDMLPSDDVYMALKTEESKKCRIDCVITDKSKLDFSGDLYLRLTLNDDVVFDDEVLSIQDAGEIEGIYYNVEFLNLHHRDERVVSIKKRYDSSLKKFFSFLKVQRVIAPIVAAIVFITIIADIGIYIFKRIKKKKTEFLPVMLKIGVLLTMWINIMIQAEKYYMTEEAFSPFYAAGSYMLYSILIGLCSASILERLYELQR